MKLVIVGGGISGLFSAYFALQKNYQVTLIEKNSDIASGTSFQNGGQLSYSHTIPVSTTASSNILVRSLISNKFPVNITLTKFLKEFEWFREIYYAKKILTNDLIKNYFDFADFSKSAFNEISFNEKEQILSQCF